MKTTLISDPFIPYLLSYRFLFDYPDCPCLQFTYYGSLVATNSCR